MTRTVRNTIGTVLALAVGACAAGAGEASALLRKFEGGGPVTVVIFGDSISAGFQIPEPEEDAFYAFFRRALRLAFPKAQVELVSRGFPGATVGDGLAMVDYVVIPGNPDLVTVQFGGNDERLGTDPEIFKSRLTEIARRVRSRTGATVLLLIQPFQQRDADGPTVKLIRQAAQRLHAPVADFDTALRQRPHDFRGWYAPFFNHPREYSSNIMARELWRVFSRTLGRPQNLDVSLSSTVALVEPGTQAAATAELANQTAVPQKVALSLHDEDRVDGSRHSVPARGTVRATFALPVPNALPDSRSVQRRVFCFAKGATSAAFDTKWVTFNPVIQPTPVKGPSGKGAAIDWAAPPPAVLDSDRHVVLGAESWDGPQDLTVKLWCAIDPANLHLGVEVRDDVVTVEQDVTQPTMFFGDCVQLNLDCREAPRQGLPFFDENVPQFFLVPGQDEPQFADWSFGDRPQQTISPPGKWRGMKMRAEQTAEGYRIELSIPLAALQPARGKTGVIGFDLVVDDTDAGTGRDTQMAWAGTALNYLKPCFYGAVRLDPAPKGAAGLLRKWRMTCH